MRPDDLPPDVDVLPAGAGAVAAATEALERLERFRGATLGIAVTLSGPQVAAEALSAIDETLARLEAFCADMRAQGIHVGVNGRCAACREEWPCEATQTVVEADAMVALRAAAHTHRSIDAGASIEQSLELACEAGLMEHAGVGDDGEPTYRLTDAGTRYVESMPHGRHVELGEPGPDDPAFEPLYDEGDVPDAPR